MCGKQCRRVDRRDDYARCNQILSVNEIQILVDSLSWIMESLFKICYYNFLFDSILHFHFIQYKLILFSCSPEYDAVLSCQIDNQASFSPESLSVVPSIFFSSANFFNCKLRRPHRTLYNYKKELKESHNGTKKHFLYHIL